jgi:hypothetical protein
MAVRIGVNYGCGGPCIDGELKREVS